MRVLIVCCFAEAHVGVVSVHVYYCSIYYHIFSIAIISLRVFALFSQIPFDDSISITPLKANNFSQGNISDDAFSKFNLVQLDVKSDILCKSIPTAKVCSVVLNCSAAATQLSLADQTLLFGHATQDDSLFSDKPASVTVHQNTTSTLTGITHPTAVVVKTNIFSNMRKAGTSSSVFDDPLL